jgi:tetrapyrrole methylase family protein / MazG family protein
MNSIKTSEHFIDLLKIVEKLRSPNGCEWDRKQNHESLIPYFIEEVYEVIESIDEKDWNNLQEELGDVLLHLILQIQIAKESSLFTIDNVLRKLNKKLIDRHPNVFGVGGKSLSWEEQKHIKKKRKSRLDGVPLKLPALIRSQRLQQKASEVGFDWKNIDFVWEKVYEELEELKSACKDRNQKRIQEELGDVLFSVVNLSRHLNISAEDMLRKGNKKFIKRFKTIEKTARDSGLGVENLTTKDMNQIWDQLKQKK